MACSSSQCSAGRVGVLIKLYGRKVSNQPNTVYEVMGCSHYVFARGKLINSSNLVNITLRDFFADFYIYPDEG